MLELPLQRQVASVGPVNWDLSDCVYDKFLFHKLAIAICLNWLSKGITWIDLTISANTIGIHNVLESSSELVGLVICRRSLIGLHPVQDGWDGGAAVFLLHTKGGS